MKDRVVLRNELVQALIQKSPRWAVLSNSLIGKELIAYGVEVLAASQDAADSIVASLDYKTGDSRSLVALSHILDCPIDYIEPAFIRCRITSDLGGIKVLAPFSCCIKVGNLTFYNVKACLPNDVVLYQGTAYTMFKESDMEALNVESVQFKDWDQSELSLDDENTKEFHNIGSALIDSVYCYGRRVDSSVDMLSRKSILYSSNDSYNLRNLYDGSVAVIDNTSFSPAYEYINFQIYWLDPTNQEFSVDGTTSCSVLGADCDVEVAGVGFGDSGVTVQRESIRKFLLKSNGLISKEQLQDYVNSFPYVLDCKVSAQNNEVYIYIKPVDSSDDSPYGDIELDLFEFGGILTDYNVVKGTSIPVQLYCNSVLSLSEFNKDKITTYIKTNYGYSNMKYDSYIDLLQISTMCSAAVGIPVSFSYLVQYKEVKDEVLTFIPQKGTIKVYDKTSGVHIGNDLNSNLFIAAPVDGALVLENQLGYFGGFLLGMPVTGGAFFISPEMYKKTSSYADSNKFVYKTISTSPFIDGVNSDTLAFQTSGYSFLCFKRNDGTSTVRVYNTESIYSDSLLMKDSIQLQTVVTDLIKAPSDEEDPTSYACYPFIYNERLYTISRINPDILSELRITFTSGSDFKYDYPIDSSSFIVGLCVKKNRLLVFMSDSTCVSFSDIDTSLISSTDFDVRVKKSGSSTYLSNFTINSIHFYNDTIGSCLITIDGKTKAHRVLSVGIGDYIELVISDKGSPVDGSSASGLNKIYTSPDWVCVSNGLLVTRLSDFVDPDVSSLVPAVQDTEKYYLLSDTEIAGSVNYSTGRIRITNGSYLVSYTASALNMEPSNYLVLSDEDNPVVYGTE